MKCRRGLATEFCPSVRPFDCAQQSSGTDETEAGSLLLTLWKIQNMQMIENVLKYMC